MTTKYAKAKDTAYQWRAEYRNMTHRWHWRKWMPERHGQLCRVLAVGRMNSALVEFEDGTKVVTSRYAVRKLIHNAEVTGAAPEKGLSE
jgi:hypothetical protein